MSSGWQGFLHTPTSSPRPILAPKTRTMESCRPPALSTRPSLTKSDGGTHERA